MCSRRGAEELVLAGRVELNGLPLDSLSRTIDSQSDRVTVDGKPVRPPTEFTYLILNKPAGYIVTRSDPGGRPTIFDLLEDIPVRIFPVGRLDKDTTGLIILTNDGELAQQVAHPSYEVEKVYHVETDGELEKSESEKIQKGMLLDDGMTSPASTKKLKSTATGFLYELKIVEGRKRQVRRMFQALGKRVLSLRRVKLGGLELGDLPEGKWRRLNAEELASLKGNTGL